MFGDRLALSWCRAVFPEEWEQFRAGVSQADGEGDIVAAYARLMEDPNPEVRTRAAIDWGTWEDAVLSLEPSGKPNPYSDRPPADLLAFVRITTQYFSNGAWPEEGAFLAGARRLTGIPGVLIHGQLDLSCPLSTAWELASAWPDARLVVVADSGHKGSDLMNEHDTTRSRDSQDDDFNASPEIEVLICLVPGRARSWRRSRADARSRRPRRRIDCEAMELTSGIHDREAAHRLYHALDYLRTAQHFWEPLPKRASTT